MQVPPPPLPPVGEVRPDARHAAFIRFKNNIIWNQYSWGPADKARIFDAPNCPDLIELLKLKLGQLETYYYYIVHPSIAGTFQWLRNDYLATPPRIDINMNIISLSSSSITNPKKWNKGTCTSANQAAHRVMIQLFAAWLMTGDSLFPHTKPKPSFATSQLQSVMVDGENQLYDMNSAFRHNIHEILVYLLSVFPSEQAQYVLGHVAVEDFIRNQNEDSEWVPYLDVFIGRFYKVVNIAEKDGIAILVPDKLSPNPKRVWAHVFDFCQGIHRRYVCIRHPKIIYCCIFVG